jgi:lipopolysaccharide transport system permease protein
MGMSISESAIMVEPASSNVGVVDTHTGPGRYSPSALPEKPLITGGPDQSWSALNLRDLWDYRELLYFLTWRDIKVRYKQTAMGAAWAIIQPLVTMLLFTLFFSIFVGVPSDGIPYPVFAYAGLLPWVFFANAVANCSTSLVASSNLITKVYFPRMVIPAAAVAAGLVDLAIAAVILVGLTLLYGIRISWSLALLPPLLVLTLVLALAVGILVSALTVRYRDIRHALPFVIQTWMFASPIIYPLSVVPLKWRWVLALNPLTGIIEGSRASLTNRALNWQALLCSLLLTLILFVISAHTFRRLEKSFADLI